MSNDPRTKRDLPTQPQPQPQPQPLPPSQYCHITTKIAVAQICQSRGFNGSQSSALDALTRIATLFLQSLAKSAVSHAAVCGGRTTCNLFDIVHALENLHLPAGFSGAGVVNQPLLSSTTLKQLCQFVDAIDEVPFARPLPRRERDSASVVFLSMTRKVDLERGVEVPIWLPGFPGFEEGAERVSKREVCWEDEKTSDCSPLVFKPPTTEKMKCGGVLMLQGKRERVKFRLGMGDARVGVDDLKLRNGVCKGGKRVCLVKRVNMFFDHDEEQIIDAGRGKPK